MTLTLVYDGGCPFCSHFAQRSELVGGLPDLNVCDGRADHALRASLRARGLNLARVRCCWRGIGPGTVLRRSLSCAAGSSPAMHCWGCWAVCSASPGGLDVSIHCC